MDEEMLRIDIRDNENSQWLHRSRKKKAETDERQ